MVKISVIIPTFNEIKLGFLENILDYLKPIHDIEVIFVDSNSTDGTLSLLKTFPGTILSIDTNCRAQRYNLGIQEAKGEMIFLHHPRSIIDSAGLEYLKKISNQPIWGGFTHQFDQQQHFLNITSWYSNQIRVVLRSIVYLDHCIFFHRSLVNITQALPQIEIFEDTALSLMLRKHSASILLPFCSTTSAVRFAKRGIYRQSLINQTLKLCYYFNISPRWMNKFYEKNLSLNSKYNYKKH